MFSENKKAYLLLIITTLGWGCNAVFAKLAVGEVSPMLLVSIRWLITMVLLVVYFGRNFRRKGDHPQPLALSFYHWNCGVYRIHHLNLPRGTFHHRREYRDHPGINASHDPDRQLFVLQNPCQCSANSWGSHHHRGGNHRQYRR